MALTRREQIAALEDEIHTLWRRAHKIQLYQAQYGASAEPGRVIEREDAEKRIEQLQTELLQLRSITPDAQAPYMGLATFDAVHARFFYGREALVDTLVERVRATSFLTVIGQSGSGKSSVVRAGLMPALQSGLDLPGSADWVYVQPFPPGPRPMNALAAALADLPDAGRLGAAIAIEQRLARPDGLLFCADQLFAGQAGRRLVLVVDQAEELWTLAPTEGPAREAHQREQQQPFIAQLLHAAAAPDRRVLIILTLRADFMGRVAGEPTLAELVEKNLQIISPMQPADLHRAIQIPAEIAGGSFEPGLADELVAQVAGESGALPLLEYTLAALWAKKSPDNTMTWAVYNDELHGVDGALATGADRVLAEHYAAPEQHDAIRAVLLRLVQPGSAAADARRRMPLRALIPSTSTVEATQALIQPLVDARLITTGRESDTGQETVEVTHEALIRSWPTLREWLAVAGADLRVQRQLEDAARDWDENQCIPDLLWRGVRLAQAEAWVAQSHPQLLAREQDFLAASRADAERRVRAERRRSRRIIAGLIAALIVITTFAGTAVLFANRATQSARDATNQRNLSQTAEAQAQAQRNLAQTAQANSDAQLRISESQRLGALAQNILAVNPELALLLSIKAGAHAESSVNQQALQSALGQMHGLPLQLSGHTGSVYQAAWSPDGQKIVTTSADDTAKVWAADGTLLTTLQGHTGSVNQAAWSPDGERIVTASDDRTAKVWTADGALLATLQGHTFPVNQAAWSPDGQQLVSASSDGTAKVWAADGTLLATLQGDMGSVYQAAWSPDGQKIVTTSEDGTAKVWAADGTLLATLQGHTKAVHQAAWSPDGARIVTASNDKTAKVWLADGMLLATLQGHTDHVNQAAWSPDGQQIVTASSDHTAKVWAVDGTLLATLQSHTDRVNQVAWSPDGKQLITASYDDTAKVWTSNGTLVTTFQGHTDHANQAVWSPDGERIVTASDDRTAKVWLADGTLLATLQGHTDRVNQAAWSPDGERIVTASSDHTAKVWATNGKLLITLQGHTHVVTQAAWSPDGKQLVTASYDGTAKVWAVDGTLLTTLQSHTGPVYQAAWSPDGKQLVTASYDGTAKVWAADGTLLATLRGHTKAVNYARFSPNGQQLVTASADGTAKVWAADGTLFATLRGHTKAVNYATFSPNGQQLVTASADGTAKVWEADGTLFATLRGHTSDVNYATFSPNGRQIVTASADGTAKVWAADSTLLITLQGHTDRVYQATFSPDGQQIVTASADGTARVWAADGTLLTTLRGHTLAVNYATFSPDGVRILTASDDYTARQWFLRIDDMLAVAKCQAARSLTVNEIKQYSIPTPLHFDFTKGQCPPVLSKP